MVRSQGEIVDMSYLLTDISLYGVTLPYEEALRVLQQAGNLGFLNERANEFASLKEEFTAIDPVEMDFLCEDLKAGLPASYPYKDFQTLIDFYDYFGFPSYQVLPQHREKIPTVYDERRKIQYHRLRYYTDLFALDADSRGDSLRVLPWRKTVYGVYIASDGYAYRDKLREFADDPRIEENFQRYCLPVLKELGLEQSAQRVVIQQTW